MRKVYPRTTIPINAVAVTTVVACLLALINLGSSVILNIVFSLSIVGFYSTYFASCALLLWRRCTGGIQEPTSEEPDCNGPADIQCRQLTWGSWRVRGWLGTAINAFACAYLVMIVFFSFWPPSTPTTPATMNYSVLVVGIVLIFSISYYHIWGKHQYNGPIIEIVL